MDADPSLEARLLAKREVRGDCWIFCGAVTIRARGSAGYGLIQAWGKLRLVHRVSAALWLGLDIQSPAHVLHTCDTPACFRPDHLFIGSALANARDRHEKGRYASGSANATAKLTETDVAAIREALAQEVSKAALGRRFGVSRSAISLIAHGKNWA